MSGHVTLCRFEMLDRLVTWPEVLKRVPYSERQIRRLVETGAGGFPKPVKVGERRVAWRESELQEWLESLPRTTLKRSD